jgi:hypothetical protein
VANVKAAADSAKSLFLVIGDHLAAYAKVFPDSGQALRFHIVEAKKSGNYIGLVAG